MNKKNLLIFATIVTLAAAFVSTGIAGEIGERSDLTPSVHCSGEFDRNLDYSNPDYDHN